MEEETFESHVPECKECGRYIHNRRSDAKFCSFTCKDAYTNDAKRLRRMTPTERALSEIMSRLRKEIELVKLQPYIYDELPGNRPSHWETNEISEEFISKFLGNEFNYTEKFNAAGYKFVRSEIRKGNYLFFPRYGK
jgi:ribosomal protein L37AE/L43A